MSRIHSFPPVVAPGARLLILGSMPGRASLEAGQYYAHPRNLFWTLLGELTGTGPESSYDERLRALTRNGIALWDVLGSCTRATSLDSDIDDASSEPNDIAGLLLHHRGITRVLFNGQKAEAIYRKHLLARVERIGRSIEHLRMPSTSPANASIPMVEKRRAWRNGVIAQLSVPVFDRAGNA